MGDCDGMELHIHDGEGSPISYEEGERLVGEPKLRFDAQSQERRPNGGQLHLKKLDVGMFPLPWNDYLASAVVMASSYCLLR